VTQLCGVHNALSRLNSAEDVGIYTSNLIAQSDNMGDSDTMLLSPMMRIKSITADEMMVVHGSTYVTYVTIPKQ